MRHVRDHEPHVFSRDVNLVGARCLSPSTEEQFGNARTCSANRRHARKPERIVRIVVSNRIVSLAAPKARFALSVLFEVLTMIAFIEIQ